MEKVTNLIPMGLFCAFIGKLIMVGVNPAECGVGFKKETKIQEVIDTVNRQNEVIAKMATEIDNLKTAIVGVKMGAGFKNKMGA
jgi:hypothetical protein